MYTRRFNKNIQIDSFRYRIFKNKTIAFDLSIPDGLPLKCGMEGKCLPDLTTPTTVGQRVESEHFGFI